jgi:hypothetical protein
MDHGRIAETGRHDELLARNGAYSRLYAEFRSAQDAAPVPEVPEVPEVAQVAQVAQ